MTKDENLTIKENLTEQEVIEYWQNNFAGNVGSLNHGIFDEDDNFFECTNYTSGLGDYVLIRGGGMMKEKDGYAMDTINNNLECEGFVTDEGNEIEPGMKILVDKVEKEVEMVGTGEAPHGQVNFTDGTYANFVYAEPGGDSVLGKWITK